MFIINGYVFWNVFNKFIYSVMVRCKINMFYFIMLYNKENELVIVMKVLIENVVDYWFY